MSQQQDLKKEGKKTSFPQAAFPEAHQKVECE